MAEWVNAPVLKTDEPSGSVSSNLTVSANKYSMKAKEFISEAPLGGIEMHGDKTISPDAEPHNYGGQIDNPSKKLLTRDLVKYFKAFEKTPFTFNFYVISSKDTGLFSNFGKERKEIRSNIEKKNPTDINVIYTNNITARGGYQPMTPWILAHRIAHALYHESVYHATDKVINEAFHSVVNFYVPNKKFVYVNMFETGTESILKFWKIFGTMRSARKNELTNVLDTSGEMIAQYLINGKVTLNKDFPEQIDVGNNVYRRFTSVDEAVKMVSKFEEEINASLTNMFVALQGKTISF